MSACLPDGSGNTRRVGCASGPDVTPPPPGVTPTPTIVPPPIIGTPRPIPYVPCDEVRSPEFHSLRPYQASPCNLGFEDLALFCGNDLIITDSVLINKEFFPYWRIWTYLFEGQPIDPVPFELPIDGLSCEQCIEGRCVTVLPGGCVPDAACSSDDMCVGFSDCIDNGDGTERCLFNVTRVRDIAIDLEGAFLPIMGFTEPSIGSESRPNRVVNSVFQSETMGDAHKVNEYVSWYINGVIGRAEYDPPDTDTDEGRRRIIDFSGPLRKLFALDSQDEIREDQENAAGVTRHDQVTVCTNLLGLPTECYPQRPGVTERRVTSTPSTHSEYIPFSSTEDRMGLAGFGTYSIQPALASTFRILWSSITNQEPAVLYFAHMQESSELAELFQSIFAYEGADLDSDPEPTVVSTSEFCDLRAIRSNPGDNLFAGEMSATVSYEAQVECEFAIPDEDIPGNLCRRLNEEVGLTADCFPAEYYCERDFDTVDCEYGLAIPPGVSQRCGVNCVEPPTGQLCESSPAVGLGDPWNGPFSCFPESWGCTNIGSGDCPSGFDCADEDTCTRSTELINLIQACPNDVRISFRVSTETPLAEDVWKRLVANPVSVFRRIFPEIEDEEGRPIRRLWDIPAATSAIYSGEGVEVVGNPASGRPANQGELYFPHIGGVHEYFLKCIQKTLRPEGFGEGCISGPEPLELFWGECGQAPPAGVPLGGGRCEPGTGLCRIANLRRFFPRSAARAASIICNMESAGNPSALNCGCFEGRSVDYSVGLFQINILAHCPGAMSYTWSPPSCTVLDPARVDSCLSFYFDADNNIRKAVSLSSNGTNWSPWARTAGICGLW